MLNRMLTIFFTLAISACAPKFYQEIHHPNFGKITTNDPRFEAAFEKCTNEIYPNGVTVYGEYFENGAAALKRYGGIIEDSHLKKQIFQSSVNDPNSVFIDEVKRTRVKCIKGKGFMYGELKRRTF